MAEKKAKKAVHYTPKASMHNQRCELCRHFIARIRQCHRVKGTISPKGWCELFKRA